MSEMLVTRTPPGLKYLIIASATLSFSRNINTSAAEPPHPGWKLVRSDEFDGDQIDREVGSGRGERV